MTDTYDLIVLGGGPVGENIADRAVQGGLTAVVVEAELVGGECSYWACMPSKALLRPIRALQAALDVAGSAEAVTGALGTAAVLERRDDFTSRWSDDGQVDWLRGAGIDLVRGHGRIAGEREVAVADESGEETVLTARRAVAIATGSDAVIPPIAGLHEANPWTSREATSAHEIPESLVVLGGGVVGVEMATAFAGLGCRVVLIARSGLLGGFEPFAGEEVARGLRAAGVDVRLRTETQEVERTDDGVVVTVSGSDRERDSSNGERRAETEIRAAEILVATGRAPRTGDIGLETIGIAAGGERGTSLETDDTLRVAGVDWLYVVGDANGRAPLTHQGKYQARAAGDAIVARARADQGDRADQQGARLDAAWVSTAATADHGAVPQVVFTDPEVASVGLTEAAARDAGHRVTAVDVEFSSVAGAALHADGYRGRARIVVDDERRVLLGATFVGPDVAELVHAATVAVVGEVPISRLWHAVPAYPTLSEVWLRLLEKYGRGSAR
ncbi:dihydrolipoyl dehydrogenase family protein [Leucobacter sp. GX0328]